MVDFERNHADMTIPELVSLRQEIKETAEALERKDGNAIRAIVRKVQQLHDAGKSFEEIYQESNLPFKDLAISLGQRRFEEATGYEHAGDHPDWDTAI